MFRFVRTAKKALFLAARRSFAVDTVSIELVAPQLLELRSFIGE